MSLNAQRDRFLARQKAAQEMSKTSTAPESKLATAESSAIDIAKTAMSAAIDKFFTALKG